MDRLTEIAEREHRELAESRRIVTATVTVVLPALISLFIGFYEKLTRADLMVFWLPLCGFITLQTILVVRQFRSPDSVHEIFFLSKQVESENAKLRNHLDAAGNAIGYLALLEAAVLSWTVMRREYVKAGIANLQDFKEAMDEVFSFVLKGKGEIFGIHADEHWNFAVYVFEKDASELVPIWREKHEYHPSEHPVGRRWGIGQGHVGKAFANRRAIITSDVTDDNVSQLVSGTSEQETQYDDDTYKSFASIPIHPGGQSVVPLGVLVATSNSPGRFDKENSLILNHAALVIGDILSATNIENLIEKS